MAIGTVMDQAENAFCGMMCLANRWCGSRRDVLIPDGFSGLTQIDAKFYGILDSGCTHTCAGTEWIEEYIRVCIAKYGEQNVPWKRYSRRVGFRFGNGTREVSAYTYEIPIYLKDDLPVGALVLCALKGGQQPLVSKTSQGSLGLVIDYEEKTAWSKRLNSYVELKGNNASHFVIDLMKADHVAKAGQAVSLQTEDDVNEECQQTQDSPSEDPPCVSLLQNEANDVEPISADSAPTPSGSASTSISSTSGSSSSSSGFCYLTSTKKPEPSNLMVREKPSRVASECMSATAPDAAIVRAASASRLWTLRGTFVSVPPARRITKSRSR